MAPLIRRTTLTLAALSVFLSPAVRPRAQTTDRVARAFVRQPGHTARAYSVAFRRDGRVLASGSWDGTIKLWDVATGRELRTLAGHGRGIYKAVFSPDGRRLASASRDGTVKLWDAATGRNTHTLRADSVAAKALDWSPDGRLLASGGNDGVVKLWDAATGREVRALRHVWREGSAGIVISLVFSPDSRSLAARNWDGTFSLWHVGAGEEAAIPVISINGAVSSIAFSPDGRLFAAVDENTKIRFWEVASGKPVRALSDPPPEGFTRQIVSVAFSPDGRRLAAGEARVEHTRGRYDGRVKLWDLASGRVVREAWAHAMEPDMLAYSPDGRLLASGGADGGVKLWDSELREVRTLSAGILAAKGLKAASFDAPDPERVLPQTPAGLRMVEWLGALNTGNVYLMRGFAAGGFTPAALARRTADERALEDFKLYQEAGGLELGRVERASDSELLVYARDARGAGWRSILLRTEAAAPHAVTLLEVKTIPAPPPVK
jgi:WD40 repeat protein